MSSTSDTNLSTLQIGHGWNPEQAGSGLDRVFYSLMDAFPSAGIEAKGLVIGAPATDANVIGAASPSDGIFRRLAAVRRAYHNVLQQYTFDLTASHFALYTFPVLDRLRSRPFVIHFHGPWALESREEGASWFQANVRHGIERSVYRGADRFIVLSDAFRNVLAQNYHVPEDRIRIVPGGVNMNRFAVPQSKKACRKKLGWSTRRPIVLSVRRLVRRVGLENLIAAMPHVRAHHPDVQLLIAGKGPLADTLQAQIEAAGLQDHVRLLGFVPDEELPLAYRAADISVVPTRSLEGFGLVAVESLAAGTPVLVTPVGGLPEVVEDLSQDLIMADASSAAIQDRLVATLGGSLSLPSAEACRAFAAAHYDWPVIAQQVRSVYEEVL